MDAPLFARFPDLSRKLPRVQLGVFPTPVELAPALGKRVWVKRDDLTAVEYGGNKVRKLEWVLADARARGSRSILTIGGTGSNHVLATAVFARKLGFAATHAVLFPQPENADLEKKRGFMRGLGVHTERVWGKPFVPFAMLWRGAASLGAGDAWPYLIGPGASSPLGTVGYVNAALELADQIERGEAPRFAAVYVPLGSGGTAAGLALGFRLAGLPTRVRAVRVVPPPWSSVDAAARLATRTARLIGAGGSFAASDFDDVGDQLGPGYGVATGAAEDAVERAAGAGLRLETTYSGKALAALLAAGRAGEDAGRDVLFWLTSSASDPDPSRTSAR